MGQKKVVSVRDIDPTLLRDVREVIREQNGGMAWRKGGMTLGQAINESLRFWLENGGHASRATADERMRLILQTAIQRAEENVAKYGRPVLTAEDVRDVSIAVCSRTGLIHSETWRRYRLGLQHGYLDRHAETIDGERLVEWTVKPQYART